MKYGNANSVLKNTIVEISLVLTASLVESIMADHDNGSTSEMNR